MTTPIQNVQQQSPLGSTNWSGNTVTTTYDPRVIGDYFAQIMQRQGQRNVYGIAAENAGVAMETQSDPTQGLDPVTRQPIQTGFDRSGFLAIPGAGDFGGERQRVEDAMYDRFTARADQRYGQQQRALEQQLRDQGFTPGTEGWDASMSMFNQDRTDAYGAAARDAVMAGGSEQSRMLADALRIRGQQGAEGQQDLTNWNQAQGVDFGQQFGLRGQGFGENVERGNVPLRWLATAQQGLPQGSMLPNFDLGLRGIDEDQASRNAWMAGLEGVLGPMLTAGLQPQGNGGVGSSPLGQLGSQALGWLGGLFGGNTGMGTAPGLEDIYGDIGSGNWDLGGFDWGNWDFGNFGDYGVW